MRQMVQLTKLVSLEAKKKEVNDNDYDLSEFSQYRLCQICEHPKKLHSMIDTMLVHPFTLLLIKNFK